MEHMQLSSILKGQKKGQKNSDDKYNNINIDNGILQNYEKVQQYIEKKLNKQLNQKLQQQVKEYQIVAESHLHKFKTQVEQLKTLSQAQNEQIYNNTHIKKLSFQNDFLRAQVVKYKNSIDVLRHKNIQLKLIVEVHKQQGQRQDFLLKRLAKQNFKLKEQLSDIKKILQMEQSGVRNCIRKSQSFNFAGKTTGSRYNLIKQRQMVVQQGQMFIKQQIHSQQKNLKQTNKQRSFNLIINNQPNEKGKKQSLFQQKQKRHLNYIIESSPSNNRTNTAHNNSDQIHQHQHELSTSLKKHSLMKQKQKIDLSEWFMECVLTVKKQILRRKSLDNQNHNSLSIKQKFWPNYVNNLEDFLKIDKKHILQLFICHEELVSQTYQKLLLNKKSDNPSMGINQKLYSQSFRRFRQSNLYKGAMKQLGHKRKCTTQGFQKIQNSKTYRTESPTNFSKHNNFVAVLKQKHRMNTKVKQQNRILVKKKLKQQNSKKDF